MTSQAQPIDTPTYKSLGRRGAKSKGGCLNCKRRHLKCDETARGCRRCSRNHLQCPGYGQALKWSTKYEKFDSESTPPGGGFAGFEQSAIDVARIIVQDSQSSTSLPDAIQEHSRIVNHPSTSISTSPASRVSPRSIGSAASAIISPGNSQPASNEDDSAASTMQVDELPINDSERASKDAESTDIPLAHASGTMLLHAPTELSSLLVGHYFDAVCRMNSAFDSPRNPLRAQVGDYMLLSPLMLYCVLSLSAAHYYQFAGKETKQVSLEFQTQAVLELSKRVNQVTASHMAPSLPLNPQMLQESGRVDEDLLLGIILLGMTSAWHNVSALGISHIAGARELFKIWTRQQSLGDDVRAAEKLTANGRLIVSSMVYWESLVSFLVDQRTEDLSHLDYFMHESMASMAQPTPWGGVCTPVMIILAKAGTLLRKKRALKKVKLFAAGEGIANELYAQLLRDARALEQELLYLRLPFVSLIEDVGDLQSPPSHIHALSRCYRLMAFLELYRAFPHLRSLQEYPSSSHPPEQDSIYKSEGTQAQLILGLACNILDILKRSLENSGTLPMQNLLLLSAGSALALVGPRGGTAAAAPGHLQRVDRETLDWRGFVTGRLGALFRKVSLRPVQHSKAVVEETWSRMDSWAVSSVATQGSEYEHQVFCDKIHWMDVMSELGLATILG